MAVRLSEDVGSALKATSDAEWAIKATEPLTERGLNSPERCDQDTNTGKSFCAQAIRTLKVRSLSSAPCPRHGLPCSSWPRVLLLAVMCSLSPRPRLAVSVAQLEQTLPALSPHTWTEAG
ncbi:hypothetical protein MHYP_G00037410 [Metynnis hypsauchen]